ncbi:MAG: glutamine-hydrolyzing carbamoyl-phosphate synthase small subunit [Alphaproteobacteria bacterium]
MDDNKKLPPAILVLADGAVFHGFSVGANKPNAIGELCFNTSMTGYQEILTDPSYAGQIINFTFPHIGIVGCNADDNETDYQRAKPLVAGAIFREIPDKKFSSWRGDDSLSSWLDKNGMMAIAGVDTRSLTHRIREKGAVMAMMVKLDDMASAGENIIKEATKTLQRTTDLKGKELAMFASRKGFIDWQEGIYNMAEKNYDRISTQTNNRPIVVYDYGIKNNILRRLRQLDALRLNPLRVVNAKTPAAEVLAMQPCGIFLSNGPGDPAATADYALPIIKQLLAKKNLPIFGICLGHQLLALALGGQTKKMTLGHRGANHPVKDLKYDRVLITSQNHGFVVADEALPSSVEVTHRSLFDNSIAGIAHRQRPVFSVQFHPEASPGPKDNFYLFDMFQQYMIEYQKHHDEKK